MKKLTKVNYQGDGVDLHYCCQTCHDSVKNLESPVVFFYPCTIAMQLIYRGVVYVFTFCPWCHFHYYDRWNLLERDLLEAYGIDFHNDTISFDELPLEFRTDAWWVERKYFDFTQSYGAKEILSADPMPNSNYCCQTLFAVLDPNG